MHETDGSAAQPVVVIGAEQSGVATGYYLQGAGIEFTILSDDERIGDTWRDRWDSLELFTPAFYCGLPGLDFPGDDPDYLPPKDEMADYLETSTGTLDLPVETETRVTHPQGRTDASCLSNGGSWKRSSDT